MNKVRISKEFVFDTAHALEGYDGACKNIHGHTYKLIITVIGAPISDDSHPKNGMVMDYGDLKKIVHTHIVSVYDHALVLRKGSSLAHDFSARGKTVLVDYQPTSENMVIDFASIIQPLLPKNIQLISVKLFETPASYCEWLKGDNLF